MKRILLSLLLFTEITAVAQSYVNYIDWDKKSIIKNLQSLAKNNTKYNLNFKDSSDYLAIVFTGFEKINCEFYFDEDSICTKASLVYYCDECAEKHIKEFVNDKYYGWVSTIPNKYYSKQKRRTIMSVFNSNPEVTTILFEKNDWTKKEYQNVIRKP